MVSVEYEYLNQNRSECFKYRGEYVAVVGTQIVAHARDLRQLVSQIEGLGDIPHIRRIPDTVDNEVPQYLSFQQKKNETEEDASQKKESLPEAASRSKARLVL